MTYIEEYSTHTVLDEALLLAGESIKTIPLYRVVNGICNCHKGAECQSPGKHPVWTRFYDKATADEKELRELYSTGDYNLGIPAGDVNAIFTLDFDGEEGMRTLSEWRERGLVDTWEVQTGSGGRHLIYRLPWNLEFEIRNTVKSIGSGVDVRGEHGYTVAPGSQAKNGNYTWINHPHDTDCMNAPQWVIDLIWDAMCKTKTRVQTEEIDVEIDLLVNVEGDLQIKIGKLCNENQGFQGILAGDVLFKSDSDRDWAIFKEMLKADFTPQEITDFVLFWRRQNGNKTKADNYYASSIAKAKAEIAAERKEAEEARIFAESVSMEELAQELKVERPTRPTVEEFPLHVFPEPVREFIQKASCSLSVPHDFVAVNILAAASIAIGKTYQIEIKKGYTQYAAIYTMLVADPGTSKSPAMDMVFKPILDMQIQYDNQYEQLKMEYEEQSLEYAERVEAWKRAPRASRGEYPVNAKGERLTEPTLAPRESIFTSDTTPEALSPLLHMNPRGMVLLQDELSALVDGMNQYKGGKGTDRQFYLSCWANSNIRVNRKRDPDPIIVNRPFLTIAGNLPPGVLMRLEALRREEDGFTDRFLIVYPDKQEIPEFTWDDVTKDVQALWDNVIKALFKEKPFAVYSGETIGHTLQMSLDAKFEWGEWHAWHHRERTAEGFPTRLQGVYSKMTNQLARITLILHMIRVASGEIPNGEIDDTTVKYAGAVTNYFKQNARKVYQTMEITLEESRVEEAMDWINAQGGSVNLRDIYRNQVAGCKKRSEAEQLLSTLVDFGYGSLKDIKPLRGPTTKEFTSFQK